MKKIQTYIHSHFKEKTDPKSYNGSLLSAVLKLLTKILLPEVEGRCEKQQSFRRKSGKGNRI